MHSNVYERPNVQEVIYARLLVHMNACECYHPRGDYVKQQ